MQTMQTVKAAFVLCSLENCQLCWSPRNKDKRRIVQSLLYSVSSMSPPSCEHIPFCPRPFHMNGTKCTSFSETGLTIAVILALMLKDICIFLWALLCQNSHIGCPGNESRLESSITLFANHYGNQKAKRPTALGLQIYNRPQSTGFGGNQ